MELLAPLGIVPDARMLARFRTYFDYLTEQNEVMNLTAINGEEDVYLRHFFDSLCLVKAGPVSGLTLLDVGAGAGFPSLPLKIAFPELKVTIVDATQKRIRFLETLIAKLELDGVEAVHVRAEDFDRKSGYDLVTARAVARMNILAELCMPFAKVGGRFIAMKTGDCVAEVAQAESAIKTLGGTVENILHYDVGPDRDHALVIVRKTAFTPTKYPRAFAQIKSKPL
ncbi:MAG TPA: 16S rRNA (guanine(527)-N(7))-methyltransferase RsmG [Acholeplasmatales bacterium]|nr:16S rRNA (guanine(527)-N(7))-methyltransferase RsmG [Acholeplasmatales bacterium]